MKEKIIREARRIVFPARCPGCDVVIPDRLREQVFCDTCLPEVRLVEGRVCFHCGKPITSLHSDLCRDCESGGSALLQGRSLFLYTGPMKTAMYRFKYSGRRVYAAAFAGRACDIYSRWFLSVKPDVIVPVPMYEDKTRIRGYNQAEVFARELSGRLSVPVLPDIIKRVRDTVPQKGLDKEKRQKNLKNAFKISQSGVKFECALLVDDIYTTGTTVNEAAKVLNEGLGCRVFSFCICVGAD